MRPTGARLAMLTPGNMTDAPISLKVMERLRRQLLARQLYTGSLVGKHGRMFVYYSTPRSPAMPDAIEILQDGTMRRI